VTIPFNERMQVLSQILGHITREVLLMGLWYDVSLTFLSNRAQNLGTSVEKIHDYAHVWELK